MRKFLKSHWKSIVAGAFAVVVVFFQMGWDPFGFKKGRLVAPAVLPAQLVKRSQHEPNGNDSATLVAIENRGGRSCLIQAVTFKPRKRLPTPDRIGLTGATLALPVTFNGRHYDEKDRAFKLRFPKPQSAPPGEWANLEVSIVEPGWAGTTYIGELIVDYNGNQTVTVDGVEIDVLRYTPR